MERRSTHYLLLLAVGREALGQQGTVLQQHLGDGLGGQKRLNKHPGTSSFQRLPRWLNRLKNAYLKKHLKVGIQVFN